MRVTRHAAHTPPGRVPRFVFNNEAREKNLLTVARADGYTEIKSDVRPFFSSGPNDPPPG